MLKVKIDPTLIPKVEKQILFASILESALKFYKDPENVARFEEWKERKEKEDAGF